MAAVQTLQYHPYSATRSGIPSFPYSPSPVSAVSAPSPLTGFLTPSQLAALHSQWTSPAFGDNAFGYANPAPTVVPGPTIAANFVSNHGKLHKRALHKSSRSKSKNDESQLPSDVALPRTKTPPASTGVSPVDGARSPSARSVTRGILKQNLRKLSQHQDNSDHDNTIDLSRTAEENEERSGLGITTSRSTSDIRNATGGYRGHSRSHSHNSQHSATSGPYQPTVPVPFLSMRDTSGVSTPPLTRTYTASIDGLEFFADTSAPPLPEDAVRRSRGATVDSSTSANEQKPKLRIITTPTETFEIPPVPILNQDPSQTSIERTSIRPRRSTNQSQLSVNNAEQNMTPRSKASFFLSRSKTAESVEAPTRAATIQAARQAFEDREEDKARKYEEQEQRAHSRQQRKIAKVEEKKRRKSDAAIATAAVNSIIQRPASAATPVRSHFHSVAGDTPERPEFRSGGEYASLESLPLPGSSMGAHHATLDAMLDHNTPDAAVLPFLSSGSKRRAVKTSYVQLVTWVRTKILNIGRRRRQNER